MRPVGSFSFIINAITPKIGTSKGSAKKISAKSSPRLSAKFKGLFREFRIAKRLVREAL